MSTRSYIGLKDSDLYLGIYCNFDGYIEGGVGECLFTHYKTFDDVKKLMALGDLSSLGEQPISKKELWDDSLVFNSKGYHEQYRLFCKAYKDREGETNTQARVAFSEQEFAKQGEQCSNGYIYLFKDNKWYIYSFKQKEFVPLRLDVFSEN